MYKNLRVKKCLTLPQKIKNTLIKFIQLTLEIYIKIALLQNRVPTNKNINPKIN